MIENPIKRQEIEKETLTTVFENQRKSLIQHCERSELRLHFEWTKVNEKRQKWYILASFKNLNFLAKMCYQTCQFQ